MKRLMSVLCMAILFASCSSDDDSSSSEINLEGSWTLTQANLGAPVDFNNDGTADPNFIVEVPCFEGDITFNANGSFTQNFSRVEAEEVNGEIVYVCNGTVTNAGSYELNGNQLTTTINTATGPEVNTTTINLNNNVLKATFDYEEYGDIEFVYQKD
ncbi:lipocalin family protein [Aequorivita sp. SDUM287046]|uniref:Lipocalin family protein n=1 Tax=Aequorivita aurantiaca TaxID=3053356 RepID=A0ABT8DF89_9FLAO|nr:lipocalin family protein [Aequorivita aurantiaca]MDN3723309.1 lipocalin family protein [Aequorivita aurantiaca]